MANYAKFKSKTPRIMKPLGVEIVGLDQICRCTLDLNNDGIGSGLLTIQINVLHGLSIVEGEGKTEPNSLYLELNDSKTNDFSINLINSSLVLSEDLLGETDLKLRFTTLGKVGGTTADGKTKGTTADGKTKGTSANVGDMFKH